MVLDMCDEGIADLSVYWDLDSHEDIGYALEDELCCLLNKLSLHLFRCCAFARALN